MSWSLKIYLSTTNSKLLLQEFSKVEQLLRDYGASIIFISETTSFKLNFQRLDQLHSLRSALQDGTLRLKIEKLLRVPIQLEYSELLLLSLKMSQEKAISLLHYNRLFKKTFNKRISQLYNFKVEKIILKPLTFFLKTSDKLSYLNFLERHDQGEIKNFLLDLFKEKVSQNSEEEKSFEIEIRINYQIMNLELIENLNIKETIQEIDNFFKEKKFDQIEEKCRKSLKYLLSLERESKILTIEKNQDIFYIFERVALLYYNMAQEESDLKSSANLIIKSALFYNLLLKESSFNHLRDNLVCLEILLREKLFPSFQCEYTLFSVWDKEGDLLEKQKLKDFRQEIQQNLQLMKELVLENDDDFLIRATRVQELLVKIKEFMSNYIYETFQNIILDFPELQGHYTLIGLGSLAKGTITPFSDLEYAILIDDSKYKETLRKIAYLHYLKIVNLGESLIPYSLYDLSFDQFIKSGFQLDLGGKTPIGRLDWQKNISLLERYDLIQEPEILSQYIKDEFFLKESFLAIELSQYIFIGGSLELFERFDTKVKEYFTPSKLKERSIEILIGKNSDLFKYRQDLALPSQEGKIFNVKPEIYRIADVILNNLCCLFQDTIQTSQLWLQIDKLPLKIESLNNLKILFGLANEIRLQTYFQNESQSDKLDSLSIENSEGQVSYLFKSFDYQTSQKILFRFYYTKIPFLTFLWKLTRKMKKNKDYSILLDWNFKDDSSHLQSLLYKRFMNIEKAQEIVQKSLANEPETSDLFYKDLMILAMLQHDLNQYREAEESCLKAIEIILNRPCQIIEFINVCYIINTIANLRSETGDNSKAIEYYRYTISFLEIILGAKENAFVGQIYLNLASSLIEIQNYYEALATCEKALRIIKSDNYDSNLDYYHYKIYDTMANIYNLTGEIKLAKYYYQKASEIIEEFYGSTHTSMGDILVNLGHLSDKENNLKEASSYYKRALKIKEKYKNEQEMAVIYINLSSLYAKRKKYLKQLQMAQKSYQIYNQIFGKNQNIHSAQALNNIANAYGELGQIKKKIRKLRRAIKIYQKMNIEDEKFKTIKNNLLKTELEYLRKANQAFLSDKLNQAEEYYQIIDCNYQDKNLHYQLAQIAFNNNYIEDAITHYQIIQKLDSNDRELYHKLACCYHLLYQRTHKEEYLEAAQKAFEQRIGKMNNHVAYAHFLIKIEKITEASKILNVLLRQKGKPDDSMLSYALNEKETLCAAIVSLVERYGEVTIVPIHLAFYLYLTCIEENDQLRFENLLYQFEDSVSENSHLTSKFLLAQVYQEKNMTEKAQLTLASIKEEEQQFLSYLEEKINHLERVDFDYTLEKLYLLFRILGQHYLQKGQELMAEIENQEILIKALVESVPEKPLESSELRMTVRKNFETYQQLDDVLSKAKQLFEKAYQITRRIYGSDHSKSRYILQSLLSSKLILYENECRYQQALDCAQIIYQERSRELGLEDLLTQDVQNKIEDLKTRLQAEENVQRSILEDKFDFQKDDILIQRVKMAITAHVYWQINHYIEAIKYIDLAIELSEDQNIAASVDKAKFLFQLDLNKEAFQIVDEAISLNQENHDAYFIRGKIYLKEGLIQKAKQDFESCIRLNSEYQEEIQDLLNKTA